MKIICIGRNYALHALELNNPVPDNPVFFLKPQTALILNNRPFFYPSFSTNIHHEVELVIKINRLGRHIDEKFAHRYYGEIGIGIDFTARDLQEKCKSKGLPWEIAKAFDGSAPLGGFIPLSQTAHPGDITFRLDINGSTVQQGNSRDMIFPFDRLISYISGFITLKIGDLIFTGTPAGVGPVKIGDRLQAWLDDRLLLDFNIR
jgi:acylpyruvate hydrolase